MKSVLLPLLSLGALLLSPSSASAQWISPVGDVDEGIIPFLERTPHLDDFVVSRQPWGPRFASSRYGLSDTLPYTAPMWAFIYGDLLAGPTHDLDDSLRDRIARGCSRFEAPLRKVRCAADSVDFALAQIPMGARFHGWAAARGFHEVLERMNIPGVEVGYAYTDRRLLNRIVITSGDGTRYAYAIDVGWNPEELTPYDRNAKRRHDPDGDGWNEDFLPPAEPRGSNVARRAETRPRPSPRPAETWTAGAAGAGVRRE